MEGVNLNEVEGNGRCYVDPATRSEEYLSEHCLVGKLLTNKPIRLGSMRDRLV